MLLHVLFSSLSTLGSSCMHLTQLKPSLNHLYLIWLANPMDISSLTSWETLSKCTSIGWSKKATWSTWKSESFSLFSKKWLKLEESSSQLTYERRSILSKEVNSVFHFSLDHAKLSQQVWLSRTAVLFLPALEAHAIFFSSFTQTISKRRSIPQKLILWKEPTSRTTFRFSTVLMNHNQ